MNAARRLARDLERATLFGVDHEPVDRHRVFERDQWRCGICGGFVDAELPTGHPQSASLDHVVPMSKGGGHTYANTQLAHWNCNAGKGNRGHGEQLALIG